MNTVKKNNIMLRVLFDYYILVLELKLSSDYPTAVVLTDTWQIINHN